MEFVRYLFSVLLSVLVLKFTVGSSGEEKMKTESCFMRSGLFRP
jgi:hypothetical protein